MRKLVVLLCGVLYSFVFSEPYLEYYGDFSFRRCVNELLSKTNHTFMDYYLLGSSYYNMRNYRNAYFYYSMLTNYSFEDEFFRSLFFYLYSDCILRIVENDDLSPTNFLWISNFISLSNGIFLETIESNYLMLLWKSKRFEDITNFSPFSSNLSFFGSMANIILKNFEGVNISEIRLESLSFLVDYYELLDSKIFYQLNREQMEHFISILISKGKFSEARALLKIYFSRFKDFDFYQRNNFLIVYKSEDKARAIKLMEDYLKKNVRVSWKSFELFLKYLIRDGYIDRAYRLLKSCKEYYGALAYDYWITVLDKKNSHRELFIWYKNLSKKVKILPRYEKRILRVLLRNNLSLARDMVEFICTEGRSNVYFYFVSGLIEFYYENYEKAYERFLRVVLNYPFTYEWIVSLKYEKNMRDKYQEIFKRELARRIEGLKFKVNFSQDDLLFYLSLDYIFPDVKKENLWLWRNIEKYFADFRRRFYDGMVISREEEGFFNEFRKLEEKLPDYMIFERVKILRHLLKGKKSFSIFYKMYDFFVNRRMEDLIIPYLASFFYSKTLSIAGYYLMEKNDLLKIFPLSYIDRVKEFYSNDGLLLWAVSLIREESHFRKDAVSKAGAIGISQIMPFVFNDIRSLLKKDINIFDYRDNLFAGMYHFDYLVRKYGGNIFYSLASYNAGETAVNNWRKKYQYFDELWVECVEYEETYNYIRKIVCSYFMYNYLIGDSF